MTDEGVICPAGNSWIKPLPASKGFGLVCFRSTAASRRIEAEAALIAVVTGASSGIGFELAKYAAQKDYDLIVAADEPQIEAVSDKLRAEGAEVIAVKADLGTRERRFPNGHAPNRSASNGVGSTNGVSPLMSSARSRPVMGPRVKPR